jgi:protein tyrosine phosphatase (PTP) superfamily phosphohydrolase (DUF442 family)
MMAILACTLAAVAPAMADEIAPPFQQPMATAAPFGDATRGSLLNYSRVAPAVATVGRPQIAGLDTAKALGFSHFIDLRQPDEPGVVEEAAHAARIGLKRTALPMPSDPKLVPAFIVQLAALLEDASGYPILLGCGSANRSAAAWTLYRARRGVPPMVAIEEGRAAGMTSREALVRQVLGLPPA